MLNEQPPSIRPRAAATKSFRVKVVVPQITLDQVPTDASGTPLPFVVLLDFDTKQDAATWHDAGTVKTQRVPPGTDITSCMLIAARSQADWLAVRQQILDDSGNGEPGGPTNQTGHS
jgi:hypothetical protein